MRRFFNGLVLGIVVGAIGYWYAQTKVRQHSPLEQREAAQTAPAASNSSFSDEWRARLDALDLRADKIKDELANGGKVFRRKAEDVGTKVSDTAADARIVAAIKAKYAVDSNLSVWQISVSSTGGHVTLSGMVNTPEDVGRAVALALEADGVRDVASTIQVKPRA